MQILRRLLLVSCGLAALLGALSWRVTPSTVEAQSATPIVVDAGASRHAIDPRIYGVNWATPAQLQALNAPDPPLGRQHASPATTGS